jgi:hypothetical protein
VAGPIQLVQLHDERYPRIRIGRNPAIRLVPAGPVELIGVEGLEARHEFGVHPARIEGRAAGEDEMVDQLGAVESQLECNRASHAVPHEVGASDVERLEQRRGIPRHVLVGEWSIDVARVTVALQLDRDHVEVTGKRGKQFREAAFDRAERPMEQRERMPGAVALEIHLERSHVDVARAPRRPHAWLR